jgi:hypothetical protein
VVHTPHAQGTPTKAQKIRTAKLSPPLPMPNEPACAAPAVLALAACSFATSRALIYHLRLTGLTYRLQIRPTISIEHSTYMVEL